MIKNTINKVFQEDFVQIIWKIEVDAKQKCIALETRNPENTIPTYYILKFNGEVFGSSHTVAEKEWTLAGIQDFKIVLKKVGENTPVKEGIQIIDFRQKNKTHLFFEYELIDIYNGFVSVRHRLFSSGPQQYISLDDLHVYSSIGQDIHLPSQNIKLPQSIEQIPSFLLSENIENDLWVEKINEHYYWCYHIRQAEKFNLILAKSDLNQVIESKVILSDMKKMIPQPYFRVDEQLFFLSNNKQEIVSYLV